jgi:hypothetical protein
MQSSFKLSLLLSSLRFCRRVDRILSTCNPQKCVGVTSSYAIQVVSVDRVWVFESFIGRVLAGPKVYRSNHDWWLLQLDQLTLSLDCLNGVVGKQRRGQVRQ